MSTELTEGLINKDTGLPQLDEEEKDAGQKKGATMLFMGPIVFYGVGLGIGCGIHYLGSKDLYEKRILQLQEYDLHWAYLSAFIFAMLVSFQNMFPMQYKSRVMRGSSKNLRANMFIYKQIGEGATESAVVFDEAGDVGLYNRSNRALYHFVENASPMIFAVVLASFVYAVPVFVLTCIFFVARIIYTIGYTNKGYGGHVPGFVLERIGFCTSVSLLLWIAIQGFVLKVDDKTAGQ